MVSVTQRINQIKQPYGGYIKPSSLKKIELYDRNELNRMENIRPTHIGLVVDYLSRFMYSHNKEKSFNISLLGAYVINDLDNAYKLINEIQGLDDQSIMNAVKLVGYDQCIRAGIRYYESPNIPDTQTIENIRILVNRSLLFFKNYGPITSHGFTFEGGYTRSVSSGDGDFLTKDTLWDFKVSYKPPTSSHTLQLLMYYIMGKHSLYKDTLFKCIDKLAIFNPRLNIIYYIKVDDIDNDIIRDVETNVIQY